MECIRATTPTCSMPREDRKNGRSLSQPAPGMSLHHSGHRLSELCMLGAEEKCVILADLEPIFRSSFDAGLSRLRFRSSARSARRTRLPPSTATRRIACGELKRAASRWAACLRSRGVLPDQPVRHLHEWLTFEMLAGVVGSPEGRRYLCSPGPHIPAGTSAPSWQVETGLRSDPDARPLDQPARLLGRETYVAGGTCRRTMHYQTGSAFSRGFWRPSRLT